MMNSMLLNTMYLTSIIFSQLELTKLHVAIHTLSSNRSVKFAPVVTSLHVEWLILGTTVMPNPTVLSHLMHLKTFLGVCDLSNFLVYK